MGKANEIQPGQTQLGQARAFYNQRYSEDEYSNRDFETSFIYRQVRGFASRYNLYDKRCLEVGCGRGIAQDLVNHYTGVDISESAAPFLHKPFCVASAVELPFRDDSFDALWTVAVLEHVYHPERALQEMRRVLKPNGLLLLAPAWYCRPWAAQGYPVRRYSDLDWRGKLTKASIPIRNSVLFRAMYIFPRRLIRLLRYAINQVPTRFRYRELKPNFEQFWMSDSDAVNSMDPYEAILWFQSRGDVCLSFPTRLSAFFVRTNDIVFRVKPAEGS